MDLSMQEMWRVGVVMKPEDALVDIFEEYSRATTLFGKFHNAHEGFAVLQEEKDELWDAIKLNQSNPNRPYRIYQEAKQVGAMALRILVDCVNLTPEQLMIYVQSLHRKASEK